MELRNWLQVPRLLPPVPRHACPLHWPQVPCILWFKDSLFAGLDVDTIMEATAIVGTGCGVLAVLGCHHASVFATAFLCYLSLFIMGQTWLGAPLIHTSWPFFAIALIFGDRSLCVRQGFNGTSSCLRLGDGHGHDAPEPSSILNHRPS